MMNDDLVIRVSDAVLAAMYAGADPDELQEMVKQSIEWAEGEMACQGS
jgi:hypothetical protein